MLKYTIKRIFLALLTLWIIITITFCLMHAIPGLGKYLVNAVKESDYTMILGMTTFYAIVLVIVNFLVDMLYLAVDRRVKLD